MENKKEFYNDLYNELYSLIGDERNTVAILANISALLNYHMKDTIYLNHIQYKSL